MIRHPSPLVVSVLLVGLVGGRAAGAQTPLPTAADLGKQAPQLLAPLGIEAMTPEQRKALDAVVGEAYRQGRLSLVAPKRAAYKAPEQATPLEKVAKGRAWRLTSASRGEDTIFFTEGVEMQAGGTETPIKAASYLIQPENGYWSAWIEGWGDVSGCVQRLPPVLNSVPMIESGLKEIGTDGSEVTLYNGRRYEVEPDDRATAAGFQQGLGAWVVDDRELVIWGGMGAFAKGPMVKVKPKP